MAAFSYQHYPFPLDSVFPPLKNLPSFTEEPNFYPPEFLPQPENQPNFAVSDNEPSSLTKKPSSDSSSVMDSKLENGEQVTQKVNHSIGNNNTKRKKKNSLNGSSSSSPIKDAREGRGKKQRKGSEMKEEEVGKRPKAKKKVGEEEPPSGYIHVRARRGQATDSHSLAERVRREKISERMKILQRLVSGCDKVTGKALMLDEIINYVQSLQNQVEFLSMKLASVNPLFYEFAVDLDALTLRPDQGLYSYTPSLSPMQQSTTIPPSVFTDATTTTTVTATIATDSTVAAFVVANNYHPVIDAPSSLLLQGQRPNNFIQENGSLMWDIEDQRQKFLNQSGLINNNLCSFH